MLFLDFRYQGRRCREYTALTDSAANRQRLQKALLKIEQQIKDGTFDYATAFPASAAHRALRDAPERHGTPPIQLASASRQHRTPPLFRAFTEQWIAEHAVEWRRSHLRTLRSTVDGSPVATRLAIARSARSRAKTPGVPHHAGWPARS